MIFWLKENNFLGKIRYKLNYNFDQKFILNYKIEFPTLFSKFIHHIHITSKIPSNFLFIFS